MNKNSDLGICIFCDLPIYKNQGVFYLNLDKPIKIVLPAHKSCWKRHRDSRDVKAFLQNNLLDYLEKYSEEEDVEEKKKSNKNRTRK